MAAQQPPRMSAMHPLGIKCRTPELVGAYLFEYFGGSAVVDRIAWFNEVVRQANAQPSFRAYLSHPGELPARKCSLMAGFAFQTRVKPAILARYRQLLNGHAGEPVRPWRPPGKLLPGLQP